MKETEDKPTIVSELAELHEFAFKRAQEKYYEPGETNANYRRGKHWSNAEIAEHALAKRIDYHMPLVESKFNGLESQQMQSPFEFVCLPATPDDDVQAEIKSALFKYEYEQNGMQYLIADWYRDMLVKRYGVIRRDISTSKEVQGEMKLTKVRFDRFLWDDNCKEFNIARHANWVQEWGESTRDQLKHQYPDKAELIDSLPEMGDRNENNSAIRWQRQDRKTELIRWVRHQQRRWTTTYKVTFNDTHTEELEKKPDFKGLPPEGQWAMDAMKQVTYPVSAMEITREFVDDYVFCKDINELLSEKRIDSELFSYHVGFGFFDDGEIACLMDWAKQPQRFIDRVTSQFDKSIGLLIKNSFQTEWDLIIPEDQQQWARLQDDLINGGANIRTRGAAGRDVIKPISGGQVAPELFQAFQFAMSILEQLTGGKEIYGLNDNKNQTKGGIEAKMEAGFTMAYMFIFNLGRALKGLGEGMNEDINEIYGNSVERTVRITDTDLDELVLNNLRDEKIYQESAMRPGRGWLKITPALKLGEAKTQINIVKGDYSPSRKSQKQMQWQMINEQRINAGLPPYEASIWMNDAYEISPTIMAKVTKADEQIAKAQEEARKMEMKKMEFEGNLKLMEETRQAHQQLQSQENTEADRETNKKEKK